MRMGSAELFRRDILKAIDRVVTGVSAMATEHLTKDARLTLSAGCFGTSSQTGSPFHEALSDEERGAMFAL